MKKQEASYTVELSLLIPMFLFVLAAPVYLGYEMYGQTKEVSVSGWDETFCAEGSGAEDKICRKHFGGMEMTEYRRYQGKSYMLFDTDALADGFEYSMLAKNHIAGLLPLHIVNSDTNIQFWYDISGRQPLEDWLKMKKTDSDFLRRFFHALAGALEQTSEYLLYEDGISLLPERIFTDVRGEEILFCYLPFEKASFDDSLCGFMEYYLAHMQHEDRDEAQKCYEVYEKCRQKDTRIEGLLQTLFKETGAGDNFFGTETEKAAKKNPSLKKEEDGRKEETKPGRKENRIHLPWDDAGRRIRRIAGRKKVHREEYAFEPKEYQEQPRNPTVFLGSERKEILGELKYEGEGYGENFAIKEPVFLIGSQKGEANGIICDDTVSRIHARITKEAEDYYLEDMNSTNGTYRNGEILNYKERVKLEKNDRITFAKETYRFV